MAIPYSYSNTTHIHNMTRVLGRTKVPPSSFSVLPDAFIIPHIDFTPNFVNPENSRQKPRIYILAKQISKIHAQTPHLQKSIVISGMRSFASQWRAGNIPSSVDLGFATTRLLYRFFVSFKQWCTWSLKAICALICVLMCVL